MTTVMTREYVAALNIDRLVEELKAVQTEYDRIAAAIGDFTTEEAWLVRWGAFYDVHLQTLVECDARGVIHYLASSPGFYR